MPGETRALELSVSLGYFTGAGILCLFEESLDIDQKSSCLDKDSIQLDLGCILWVMLEVRSVFFFFLRSTCKSPLPFHAGRSTFSLHSCVLASLPKGPPYPCFFPLTNFTVCTHPGDDPEMEEMWFVF